MGIQLSFTCIFLHAATTIFSKLSWWQWARKVKFRISTNARFHQKLSLICDNMQDSWYGSKIYTIKEWPCYFEITRQSGLKCGGIWICNIYLYLCYFLSYTNYLVTKKLSNLATAQRIINFHMLLSVPSQSISNYAQLHYSFFVTISNVNKTLFFLFSWRCLKVKSLE